MLVKSLDHLEGDPRSTQVAKGIAAAGHPGVDDSHGVGNAAGGSVMVGDDDVHPQPSCVVHLGDGGYSAVHGDQQADPLFRQLLDGRNGEAVAFLAAVRQIGDHRHAEAGQPLLDDGGTGDSVHVEVAEHPDGLTILDGAVEAGHRPVHAAQPQGVVGQVVGRVEEYRQLLRGCHATPGKYGGNGGGDVLGQAERARGGRKSPGF